MRPLSILLDSGCVHKQQAELLLGIAESLLSEGKTNEGQHLTLCRAVTILHDGVFFSNGMVDEMREIEREMTCFRTEVNELNIELRLFWSRLRVRNTTMQDIENIMLSLIVLSLILFLCIVVHNLVSTGVY